MSDNSENNNGFVYILANPAYKENLYKIGYTEQTPDERAAGLSKSTGVPAKFQPVHEVEISSYWKPKLVEQIIHSRLDKFRYTEDREFFELPLEKAVRVVEDLLLCLHTQRIKLNEKEDALMLSGQGHVRGKTDINFDNRSKT
ncbi:MAG: GIY-YIG nuclease family protein [Desulfobacterales bacterium]|nr:GIY-YIG nuclease family protein [Desulfobacterales bacterium]